MQTMKTTLDEEIEVASCQVSQKQKESFSKTRGSGSYCL